MAQNFYTKWQNAILADAGVYVSKTYINGGLLSKTVCCYGRKGVGNKVILKEVGHGIFNIFIFNHIFFLKLSNFFAKIICHTINLRNFGL